MTATVVLDSSVLLKWFRQGEEQADRALALRAAFLEGELEVVLPWLEATFVTADDRLAERLGERGRVRRLGAL